MRSGSGARGVGHGCDYFLEVMFFNYIVIVKLEHAKPLRVFNPVPTRLFHVIYYHGDKKFPSLVGIGLKLLPPKRYPHAPHGD